MFSQSGKLVLQKYYDVAVKKHLWRSKKSLMLYLDFLFQDITFARKSVLDIGGGSGLLSFYAAIQGADKVICIEPELAGSDTGAKKQFEYISAELSLTNVYLQSARFQDFDAKNDKFDMVIMHNSINHLDENACIKLQCDAASRGVYDSIFSKLSAIMASNAKLIIADCSRNNFFNSLKLKNPFSPTIEWHKHQSPDFWAQLLSLHGFVNPRIRWMSFSGLHVGRLLFSNYFMSFLLNSHFILLLDKAA